MKHHVIFKLIALFFLSATACAQTDSSIVLAEKEFAKAAREGTYRQAFLRYLDSSGIIFSNGKFLNGKEYFLRQMEDSGKLLWSPVFAYASKSGDLGFTTGPFEYRNSTESEVLAAGQYSSIWHRNESGSWKLVLDLGINYSPSVYNASFPTKVIDYPILSKATENWMAVELEFIRMYNERGMYVYEQVLTSDSWFNIEGKRPVRSQTKILDAVKDIPEGISFNPLGGAISSYGDLFYVYGETLYRNRKENYLRIWIHTAEGWKMILQVLKW